MTNLSLQKKTAARIAAVQCLYQQAVMSEAMTPAAQIAALKASLKDNRSEQKLRVGLEVEPHYPLVEALLSGVAAESGEITIRLEGALSGEWKRERMSPLLVAILQCAIVEMFFHKGISARVVIDEYTRLARRFFADREVNFIHGALSKLVEQYS